MSYFNSTEPIIRFKQEHLDVQDLKGLWKLTYKIGDFTLYSRSYTRIDQAFLLWGWLTLIIFVIAQFWPVSWMVQAYWWSFLTLAGTLGTIALTYCWTRIEGVTWIVYWWAGLLTVALALTNLGIFGGWSPVLLNLCPLWLGASALGYWGTALGLRSRAFFAAGFLHLLAIWLLPYLPAWQFLASGAVMGGTLLLFAEIQWDMRPPVESPLLTAEQLAFNRAQQRQRQLQ